MKLKLSVLPFQGLRSVAVNFFSFNNLQMKSLVKQTKKSDGKVAQCCAKNSKTVAGCHD